MCLVLLAVIALAVDAEPWRRPRRRRRPAKVCIMLVGANGSDLTKFSINRLRRVLMLLGGGGGVDATVDKTVVGVLVMTRVVIFPFAWNQPACPVTGEGL